MTVESILGLATSMIRELGLLNYFIAFGVISLVGAVLSIVRGNR